MPSENNLKSAATTQMENGKEQMLHENGSCSNGGGGGAGSGEDDDKQFMDNKNGNSENNHNSKTITSFDPIEYVQRTRVTKPVLAKPATDPLQFIKIKPIPLYQTAQEQLKKAEEVKKVKEVKKEEAEDWQSNLDNWKSSRRKRVEHIIDRVVEVKKFENEDFDRTRRKSKTFNEMLEERSTRSKISLPVYAEDDSNDLSDLGIGTSSASGKSSLSEDYDNHSVTSDSQESTNNINHHENGNSDEHHHHHSDHHYEQPPLINSPECEYTYEGAIQDYKTRISKQKQQFFNKTNDKLSSPPRDYTTTSNNFTAIKNTINSTSTTGTATTFTTNSNIFKTQEKLLLNNTNNTENLNKENYLINKNLPKIDISKKKELFEQCQKNESITTPPATTTTKTTKILNQKLSEDFSNAKSIKERLSFLNQKENHDNQTSEQQDNNEKPITPEKVLSLKDRLTSLEKQISITSTTSATEKTNIIDAPIVSIKDRLSSLHSSNNNNNNCNNINNNNNNIINKEIVEQNNTENINNKLNNQKIVNQKSNENHCDLVRSTSQSSERCIVFEFNNKSPQHNKINNQQQQQSPKTPEKLPNEFLINNSFNQQNIIERQQETQQQQNVVVAAQQNYQQQQQIEEQQNYREIEEKLIEEKFQELSSSLNNNDGDDKEIIEDFNLCITPEPMIHKDDHETSVLEALEIAFEAIDREEETNPSEINSTIDNLVKEPIYEDITYSDIEMEEEEQQLRSLSQQQMKLPLPMQPQKIQQATVIHNSILNIQNVNNMNQIQNKIETSSIIIKEEPYYQVPKSSEPYYEIPKPPKPVPLYENVDIFYTSGSSRVTIPKEPPKEKPPPPPVDQIDDDDDDDNDNDENDEDENESTICNPDKNLQDQFRRVNSTRRIKNEIRTQRSSFLGLSGNENDNYLELSIAPPPDMMSLLREEKRLEKQIYLKAGLYDNSDAGDSRDSGVSENHSRQSSDLFTSSEELNDFQTKKEMEINFNGFGNGGIVVRNNGNMTRTVEEEIRMKTIEEQIREQEEVLRVERELLQLEQEELKRQATNLLLRENLARRELDHGTKMLMSANRRSMTDVTENNGLSYVNIPNNIYDAYQVQTDFRKSMPDLQHFHINENKKHPPSPPAKPLRAQFYQSNQQARNSCGNFLQSESKYDQPITNNHIRNNSLTLSESNSENVVLRNNQPGNMSKHTLHALSAVPKPKYTDVWVQQNQKNRKSFDQTIYQNTINLQQNGNQNHNNGDDGGLYRKSISTEYIREAPPVRKQNLTNNNLNYNNKHWFLQEAEQRRLEEQQPRIIGNGVISNSNGGYNRHSMPGSIIQHQNINNNNNNQKSNNKPLPDSIIQTLTHRIQSRGIGERKNLLNQNSYNLNGSDTMINHNNHINNNNSNNNLINKSQDNILSVSGKKKCSHCGEELEIQQAFGWNNQPAVRNTGRGAAMIIESLRLFYHIDCFKCCVCCIQLGDGLNGTDVRVRNQKLHCHNCYSSDDGVKFSCV